MNRQQLLNDLGAIQPSSSAAKLHNAIGGAVMRAVAEQWEQDTQAAGRHACYLSMEFLIGRVVLANLLNLGVLGDVHEGVHEGAALGAQNGYALPPKGCNPFGIPLYANRPVQGGSHDGILKGQCPLSEGLEAEPPRLDLRLLEEIEDAALGNGGLGRLAACYLESAATKGLPLDGYGLRYKYGLFRQEFRNGFQIELPDDWQKDGDPWSTRREEETETVCFAQGGVRAVPYDMPVIGWGGKRIGRLRLWQAEGENAGALCDCLYPDDSTDDGKRLRIMQEYLLSSASLQSAVREYMRQPGADMSRFAEARVFQLNDTHPVLAIPELVRILTTEYELGFADALETARHCFAYTNHTIMAEALESWDIRLMAELLPDIVRIIHRIDRTVRRDTARRLPHDEVTDTRIVRKGRVHMARLAAHVCDHVNGVAEIHTGILKNDVFRAYETLYPGKILNVTNGVTQRRWLALANPLLAEFITERVVGGWITDLDQLSGLRRFEDAGSVAELCRIKRANKERLATALKDRAGLKMDPDALLDAQIKRLHEYKR